MRKKYILLCSLLFLLFSSCAPKAQEIPLSISKKLMKFPTAEYTNVIYVNNEVVAFIFDINMEVEKRRSFVSEHNLEPTPFVPEIDSACTRHSSFLIEGILPDGRLGLMKECVDNSGPTIYLSTERSIYAYDWNTQKLERLVAGKLTGRSNVKGFSWNPDMTMGVLETNSYWQGTLSWIDRNSEKPMDIEITDRGLTWNLKDRMQGAERAGLANFPAWSHDGQTIAFFATPYGIREEPLPKYNLRHDLFLMDSKNLVPKLELSNIADAYKLFWSPNGQHLLFSGCYGMKLVCGLWGYKLTDKTLSLIDSGSFKDFIWITNERIVAVKTIAVPADDAQIWEYTIDE